MTDFQSQTVSLNEIGLKYAHALQRLSDLMVFSWAGTRILNEQSYDECARTIPGLPATQFRLAFDAAREESERWLLKQSVNECIGLCTSLLEDVRRLCALVTFNIAREKSSGNLAALASEVNTAPGQVDIQTRISKLKETYGVQVTLEPEIVSLLGLGRCLFQTNGVVSGVPSVTIHLKMVVPPNAGETQARMGDYERVWKPSEKVTLSRQEHAAIFTTISLFIGSMLTEIQEFAKRSGLPAEPAQQ